MRSASDITRLAAISIVVALLVTALKYLAYVKTGSVALYSDALESVVNVVTAVAALVAVRISQRPPDRSSRSATIRLSTSPSLWKAG